jgi:hypothetical protein
MPHTNVKSVWVDGDLVFYDKSNNEIFRIDGTNRKFTLHASAIGSGLVTAPSNATYKIARGEATLDGSNPTTAATGLTTIVSASVTLKTATAPGDDPSWLTCNYTGSDGNLDIYAWKNTGGTDPTLVASTNSTAVVSWIAVGT